MTFPSADFSYTVGRLDLTGPLLKNFSCTLSLPCNLTLSGTGFLPSNEVMVIRANGTLGACGVRGMPLLNFTGVTNPARVTPGMKSHLKMVTINALMIR